ncbi:hypothetical protein SAMN05421819_2148 [Bryocella elongata]|uniref:Terminase-like family protein n=2 Tax=Bryocella elongata TaxID=863522 RepID=A0A1H5Y6H9_9BACT|nr:hypothetical protein SAMN05421819_2148 [Bryocella elongata]
MPDGPEEKAGGGAGAEVGERVAPGLRSRARRKPRTELEALVALGKRIEQGPRALIRIAERWLLVRGRSGELMRLRANAAQRSFEERRGRQNIVLKARQMGVTTWIAGRFFLRTVTRPGSLTMVVAQNRDAAEAIFKTVHRMWEGLPEDLREGPLRRSHASAGRMVFPELDSEMCVGSASDSNAGRGVSLTNLLCSEVSRWPGDAVGTLAGLRAALAPDGEMVLESTPNGAYGAFYEEWMSGVDECGAVGDVVRHFFPWWMEERYVGPEVERAAMRDEELALVTMFGLSGAQIGYRRGLEKSFGVLRSQEYAEDAVSCFRASDHCCFDVAALESRLGEVQEPRERRRGGALWVFLPAMPRREYIVAVDTAGGGVHGDFSAVQVIERSTGLQCAELRERLGPAETARVAADLAREYGGAVVVVERNNHGSAVLAYLETRERYARVYESGGQAGWLTSAATRPEMIARMRVLLEESAERFLSRRLLEECRTFTAGTGGRYGAAAGSHDDLVMAMGIAQTVREELISAAR